MLGFVRFISIGVRGIQRLWKTLKDGEFYVKWIVDCAGASTAWAASMSAV